MSIIMVKRNHEVNIEKYLEKNEEGGGDEKVLETEVRGPKKEFRR